MKTVLERYSKLEPVTVSTPEKPATKGASGIFDPKVKRRRAEGSESGSEWETFEKEINSLRVEEEPLKFWKVNSIIYATQTHTHTLLLLVCSRTIIMGSIKFYI